MRMPLLPVLLLAAAIAVPADAQVIAPSGPAYRTLPFEHFSPFPPDTVPLRIKPTYWKEGGIIGASVLGGMALLMGALWCGNSDSGSGAPCMPRILLGTALSGGVGFVFGAFIGGMAEKPSLGKVE